jgi:DNA-directed RNA polymerase subunit RPC12/RpoP
VIKFRCQNCGQKIAVDDVGIGVTIGCPSCTEQLIVPPRTDVEFLPSPPAALDLTLVTAHDRPNGDAKAALLPHLARAMMNRVFQAVLFQRRQLLDTQASATAQVAELEQRVVLLHARLQRRLAYYQERVAVLEAENRELRRRSQQTARTEFPPASLAVANRVNLRDAGFLLRS